MRRLAVAALMLGSALCLWGTAGQAARLVSTLRNLNALATDVEHLVERTEVLSSELYDTPAADSEKSFSPIGPVVLLVTGRDCDDCAQLERLIAEEWPGPGANIVPGLVAASAQGDVPDQSSPLASVAINPRRAAIADLQVFRARTGIGGVPTMLLVRADGSVASMMTGALDRDDVRRLLSSVDSATGTIATTRSGGRPLILEDLALGGVGGVETMTNSGAGAQGE